MKRKSVKIISVMVAVAFVFGAFTGCNKKNEAVGPNTIQISYTLGSFGEDWLNEAVKEFNKAFESEGYVAVVDRVDAAFTTDGVFNEIKMYEDNTYDLYITISDNISLVDESVSVLRKKDECLLEDLTEMYNSKVINLDGTEGTETVLETRNSAMLPYQIYNYDNTNFKGKYFSYQWTTAYSGIIMNRRVLEAFGYSYAPRTTKEMKEICDNIVGQKRVSEHGNEIKPTVWPGNNASGYSAYPLLTWLAQYMGVEGYNNFFKLQPETGDVMTNGYDVYDNEGILYALRAMETFFAQEYAADGSVYTLDHLLADQVLMDDEALFEFTGDWAYSEIAGIGYDDETLSYVEAIAVPVLSELADKIGLSGNADQKDAVLRSIVQGVDDGKTDDVIASENGVRVDQVATVREARGIYYDLGCGHQAVIPSYSDAKEVAKLFLRFISSNEFAEKIYSKKANGLTANKSAKSEDTNFLKSLTKICGQSYSTPIAEAICLSDIRYKGAIQYTFEPLPHYGMLAKSMAVHLPEYTAEVAYSKVKNSMKNNWDFILQAAGYHE